MASGICGRVIVVACGRIFRVIIILSDDCEEGIALDVADLSTQEIENISPPEKEQEIGRKKSHAISSVFHLIILVPIQNALNVVRRDTRE